METMQGRRSLALDLTGLNHRLTDYTRVILDLGTGDGKFVRHLAGNFPDRFIIGVDACRENLQEHSRAQLPNMLFVIANAQALPAELNGLASLITINFPWGSLLEGLLHGDPALLQGLTAVAQRKAQIEIQLNGGALSEAGADLESGAAQIEAVLREAGWQVKAPSQLRVCDLQKFPSTWAKRLAYGRDPWAMRLSGCFPG